MSGRPTVRALRRSLGCRPPSTRMIPKSISRLTNECRVCHGQWAKMAFSATLYVPSHQLDACGMCWAEVIA
jgi:hypothetical protein